MLEKHLGTRISEIPLKNHVYPIQRRHGKKNAKIRTKTRKTKNLQNPKNSKNITIFLLSYIRGQEYSATKKIDVTIFSKIVEESNLLKISPNFNIPGICRKNNQNCLFTKKSEKV